MIPRLLAHLPTTDEDSSTPLPKEDWPMVAADGHGSLENTK